MIEGTAKLHGCTAEVKWSEQAYIPTVNDAKLVSVVEEAAVKLAGADRWQRMAEPTMAAEDFGFLAGLANLTPATRKLVKRKPGHHKPHLCTPVGLPAYPGGCSTPEMQLKWR